MGATFTGQRCSDCSGALEFDKAKKLWVCPYCGKTYERDYRLDKVQIDGLAGINEIVRATISDISKYDFSSAEKNLSECEKVNANHVGTTLANLCYYLFKAANSTKEESQMYLGKASYYSKKLQSEFPHIEEDEKNLYEYINNPELYAVLYITFNSVNSKERENFVYQYIELNNIVNPKLNRNLLLIAFKVNQINDVNTILNNINFIDKRFSLNEVLKKYPDDENKKKYINELFKNKAFTDKDELLVNNYSNTSKDKVDTKLLVFCKAYEIGIPVNISSMLELVFNDCKDEEVAKRVFDLLKSIKLKRDDVQIVLDYCLSASCPTGEISSIGLTYLKESGTLFEINASDIQGYLTNYKYSIEDVVKVLTYICENFNISQKSMDAITSFALLQFNKNSEERKQVLEVIFKKAKSITIKTLEDYVLTSSSDGKNKPLILEMIVKLGMNPNYFNNLLDKYMDQKIDIVEIRDEIVIQLMNMKLRYDSQSLSLYLLNRKVALSSTLLSRIKAFGVNPEANTIIRYFSTLSSLDQYDVTLVDYLLDCKFSSNGQLIERYLLKSTDQSARKRMIGVKLINNIIDKNFSSSISFTHNGYILKGNLAQAFLLSTVGTCSDKLAILEPLVKLMKLSDPMILDNKPIKFKKYIVENKQKLDHDVDSLCESLGVYKLFF